jgi:hypothetical protein
MSSNKPAEVKDTNESKPKDTEKPSEKKSNVTTMPNPSKKPQILDDNFIKNLFQTIQGVKYDALCPHGLPYYACMSCSH